MTLPKFYRIQWAIIFIFFTSIVSCKKQPGIGGVAQITGNVYADTIFDNKNNKVLGSGYLASIVVYLCYDNDTIASQSTKTSYSGAYKFDYLQKGNYSVYVLSDKMRDLNDTMQSFHPFGYVKKEISIKNKKDIIKVETMHINYAY
jgi:hypothetical protein